MATDSSPDPVSNGGGGNSPHPRRRSLPSPWASVVRGDSEQNLSPTAAAAAPGSSLSPPVESASDNSLIESSDSEPQAERSDVNGDGNAGLSRRPAWNRPVNGVVEPASVMGGTASWPALSETTRPVPRSPSDSSRPVSDGSAPLQAPLISQPPQRPANHSSHGNSTGNNSMPGGRPRQRNRGGGGNGGGGNGGGGSSGSGQSPQNTFNQQSIPMPPPFPVFEVPYGMILDNSVRGARPLGGGGVGASQSHTGNDHSSQRNNSRRGGYGGRPRGDGSYHNNHGGRRDDRREVPHPPQYVPPPMGYMPPPMPPGAPFMAPPPMRVFPGQMAFDMSSPFIYVPPMAPESFRAMPIVPPPAPMIFPPANEVSLTSRIVKQIDFYFSDANLVKDSFLRSKMDEQGWVPIALIATFRQVQRLTNDIQVILESLRYSTVVEVQGDKVRRRNEWNRWLLSSGSVNSDSGSRSSTSAPENALASSLQQTSLDDVATNPNGILDATEGHTEMGGSQLLEDSTNQAELANGDDTAEVQPTS